MPYKVVVKMMVFGKIRGVKFVSQEDYNSALQRSQTLKNNVIRSTGTIEKTTRRMILGAEKGIEYCEARVVSYTDPTRVTLFEHVLCLIALKYPNVSVHVIPKKQRPCKVCEAMTSKKCSCCRKTYYCCRDHQVIDWTAHRRQITVEAIEVEIKELKNRMKNKEIKLNELENELKNEQENRMKNIKLAEEMGKLYSQMGKT